MKLLSFIFVINMSAHQFPRANSVEKQREKLFLELCEFHFIIIIFFDYGRFRYGIKSKDWWHR